MAGKGVLALVRREESFSREQEDRDLKRGFLRFADLSSTSHFSRLSALLQ